MDIPNGVTTLKKAFVARSSVANEYMTGLTSFVVYRSRNGAIPVAYDNPTIAEVSATNMAGVYTLLVDEDTTISGDYAEEYVLRITSEGMRPVTIACLITPMPSAISDLQDDLDLFVGDDGVVLNTVQPNYAPSTHAKEDIVSNGPITTSSGRVSRVAQTDTVQDLTSTLTDFFSTVQVDAPGSVVTGSTITVKRGDTVSFSVSDLGDISSVTAIAFTVKKEDYLNDSDDDRAELKIDLIGLQIIAEQVASTLADATLVVNVDVVDITFNATASTKLRSGKYSYDVQITETSGEVRTPVEGVFVVTKDVTRNSS